MALKHKKTRMLRKSGGSSRFWSLGNLRRQLKKKQARGRNRRCSGFANLQLSGTPISQEPIQVFTMEKETTE
ncbi:hypothetical protein [Enterovibrio paralichthyis]|uniref:hypothetical protein n=1 Tax=Enterovibrio paralichthyis TaxID=2853805 RepID=UPI002107F411|nr:hypothetical protein [Enterovibrio paralichthyis]